MATSDIPPPSWFAEEWLADVTRWLSAWRAIAERNGNTTLVALTDHAISSGDAFELESVRQLYADAWLSGELDKC